MSNYGSFQRRDSLIEDPVTGFERRQWHTTLLQITLGTLQRHWISIVGSFFSAGACVAAGWATHAMLDALIFKSVFVFFGFAIGFRNVRAHQRRSGAQTSVRGLLHTVWDIIVLFPDDTREALSEHLVAACESIANYITLVSSRSDCNYALAGLEPEPQEQHWWCQSCLCKSCGKDEEEEDYGRALNMGPSTLVAATLLRCEDEVDRLSGLYPDTQKYRRTFWAKKLAFDKEYGMLVDLAIPSVSDAYAMQINLCLFLFAVLLPWGLKCSDVTYRGKIIVTAGTFLVLNTLLVNVILLGLNALAAEQEDPFQRTSSSKIDIINIVSAFRAAVAGYEKRRARFKQQEIVDMQEGDLLAVHQAICGSREDQPPLLRAATAPTLLRELSL